MPATVPNDQEQLEELWQHGRRVAAVLGSMPGTAVAAESIAPAVQPLRSPCRLLLASPDVRGGVDRPSVVE